MTFRIGITSTSKTKHPSETTAIQETTVTYSTIENHVETVNEAFSTTRIVEGWPGQAPKQEVDGNFPSKQRKRKSTEGEEEVTSFDGPLYCYLWELGSESWTYKLSASNWSESVYHLTYLRADGTLSEREVWAEALTESLSEHDLEAPVDMYFATSVFNPSIDQQRRCELLGNERILDDATWQLEEMLSGMSNIKVIASQILSRLDFVEITLLACTIVVGQLSSESWSKKERKAFRRKFNDAIYLSWNLDDVLGAWEQLLKSLLREVHIWQPQTCTMDQEVSYDGGSYLETLENLGHNNAHRLCEATRSKMNRSRCIIKWDLTNLKVAVLYC